MDVFSNYLKRHCSYKPFIKERPHSGVANIIVIPAIGEPDLINTIHSLWNCAIPINPVEILVVLNSSESSVAEIIELNKKNELKLIEWAKEHNSVNLSLYTLNVSNIPIKHAGAGLARKIGMDEAVHRFGLIENQSGIISSLDADCVVSTNYLVEIERLFAKDPKCNGCSIYFEHSVEGSYFDSNVYKTIAEYELHLRYYRQMLINIGFPYFQHTVGSCFAVNAQTYCKLGGMNRRQAGEDFYFLHKIIPQGHFYELNTTCVYPSSRPSFRVPFGTGATIRQFAIESQQQFLTYDINSFLPLKELFEDKELFFKIGKDHIAEKLLTYNNVLIDFLSINDFNSVICEINSNTNQIASFNKRFFDWFDAFRLVKYMNFAHTHYFSKQMVSSSTQKCLVMAGLDEISDNSTNNLLNLMRDLEKE